MKNDIVNKKGSAGFSLIEILVGMIIGIIGIVIMMQVFSLVESQKRTTTGTGDAQTTGSMAMYMLQRDIRLAGYGFNSLNAIGCSLNLGSGKTIPVLAHVIINPAGLTIPAADPNTDILMIAYGTGNGATEGEMIINASGTQLMMPSSKTYANGDKVMAASKLPTNNCALKLVDVIGVSGQILSVSDGVSATEDGSLFNLGRDPKVLVYAVRSGNLTVCDYMVSNCADPASASNSSIWVPVASGIVSLRAQYGRDTTAPVGVDLWDRETPVFGTDQEAFACSWVRVPAVRIALVARNANLEKDKVTLTAPTWYGTTASATNPDALPINLTATRDDWEYFRYRLFQTVIPIRNMPWITLCP